MGNYSLPHSDIAKKDALTNEPLITASHWQCERWTLWQIKWTTIHYLRVRMWEMDSLTNGQLLTSSHWQCVYGRFYKWTTINCFTVTVERLTLLGMDHNWLPHNNSPEMDALTNWALFTASQWQYGYGRFYQFTTIPCLTRQCGDGRSYTWTTIHSITVTVPRRKF